MSISFSSPRTGVKSLEPVPGSLRTGGGDDDRSGPQEPSLRAAAAANGSCEALIDTTGFTLEDALALASPPGPGDFEISGEAASSLALVDVEISGRDGLLYAGISWKGASPS